MLTNDQEWLLVHRAHLHTALREKAIGKEGKGTPCQLKLSSRVASVDPELAEVTLESGEKVRGDLILGADGVHVSRLDLAPDSQIKSILMHQTVSLPSIRTRRSRCQTIRRR